MGEGGGCFPAGVMVSTPTGKRAIETLKVGDEVIGAVGVGGAPSGAIDEECAQAGIEKVKAKLR